MADIKYKLDWVPDTKKLSERAIEDTPRKGIASRPETGTPKQEDYYTKMYRLMSSYFDSDEEASKVLSSKKPDSDAIKGMTMQEYAEAVKQSAYEVSQAREMAGITQSLTEGGGEIGRKPLPEGTTLRPVGRPPMTTMRDVTGTDEGKLDNEQPLRDLSTAVSSKLIKAVELETPVEEETDEDVNTLVEQLTNTRITAGKDVEESAPVTAEAKTISTTQKGGLMERPVSVEMSSGVDTTQQLLDRIALGEGAAPEKLKAQAKHGIGTTPYDMVYNYGNTVAPSKPVTEMTLKELEAFQRKLINATKGKVKGTSSGTSAVGKYQVVKTSLFGKGGTAENPKKNSWAGKLGLKADTVYTPEVQESIGMLALKEAGYNAYINGQRSQDAFQNRIANIWASVAKADGTDIYGQGIHTFKEDLQPMLSALAPQRNKQTAPKESLRPKTRPERTEE